MEYACRLHRIVFRHIQTEKTVSPVLFHLAGVEPVVKEKYFAYGGFEIFAPYRVHAERRAFVSQTRADAFHAIDQRLLEFRAGIKTQQPRYPAFPGNDQFDKIARAYMLEKFAAESHGADAAVFVFQPRPGWERSSLQPLLEQRIFHMLVAGLRFQTYAPESGTAMTGKSFQIDDLCAEFRQLVQHFRLSRFPSCRPAQGF